MLPSSLMLGNWGDLRVCWGALERTGSSLLPEAAPGKGSCSWCGAELGRRDEEDGGVHWEGFLSDTPPPLAALCSPALLPESLGPCANGCSVSFPLRQATCWEKRGDWPSPRGHPKKLGGGLKGQRGCALSQPGGPRLSLGVPGVGLLLSVTQLGGVGGG